MQSSSQVDVLYSKRKFNLNPDKRSPPLPFWEEGGGWQNSKIIYTPVNIACRFQVDVIYNSFFSDEFRAFNW